MSQVTDIFNGIDWIKPVLNDPFFFYLLLFVGLLIAGETVLLPAIYISSIGYFSLWYVLIVAIFTSFISDFLWYLLGYHKAWNSLNDLKSERVKKLIDKLQYIFDKNNLKILFFSKFVYGTRIAVQILCGIKRLPFRYFLFVNILSTVMITFFYAAVIVLSGVAVENIGILSQKIHIAFIIAILALACLHGLFYLITKKSWFQ